MQKSTILQALKEYGSENVKTKLNEPKGEDFCASYINEQIEKGADFETSLGWLEQYLSDIYNN
jgi:hypothetical protein